MRRYVPWLLPALAVVAGTVVDAVERPLVNDRCPVMSDEFASPTQEITFHGAAVRFCCGKCKRRFEDEPADSSHDCRSFRRR